jgi:hypothetical protein
MSNESDTLGKPQEDTTAHNDKAEAEKWKTDKGP